MIKKINRITHFTKAYFALKSEDIILASFPKSGNTWVRFFLSNLISENELEGREISFKTLDNMMPSFGTATIFEKWPYQLPRFIKTHLKYGPYLHKPKKILIIRDPRDVMVSYFHYVNNLKIYPTFELFSDFIRNPDFGLERWLRHWKSWESNYDYLIKYESLKENDTETFKAVLNHFKIPFVEENLNRAVEKSRFKNFRKVEKKYGHTKPGEAGDSFTFTRKGIVGDYMNHFSEEDLRYYQQFCKKHNIQIKEYLI